MEAGLGIPKTNAPLEVCLSMTIIKVFLYCHNAVPMNGPIGAFQTAKKFI